jgi:response regulator RpfG family c-di-GMP phosphodiesterase
MSRILIVDGEAEVVASLARVLRKEFQCTQCTSPIDALALCQQEQFDLVISDIRMPKMTGIELLAKLQQLDPVMGRILITGYADMEDCQSALDDKTAHIILAKPWDNDELKAIIKIIMEMVLLKRENMSLKAQLACAEDQ